MNIETFIGCKSEYQDADIVLFGAPFDGTTSYRPGTRFASKAVRSESEGVETYSPYQDKDLSDCDIYDGGDLEFPFGNTEKVLKQIEEFTHQVLDDNKLPFMIGGEHLVTLGTVRAMIKKYPDLCVVHLDAHTDLRETYLGEQLSHATVMKRVWELLGDGRIYQFGIRSGERDEFEFAKEHTLLHKFDLEGMNQVATQLKGKPIYLSLDMDVLDPSIFPGTGTPEAGGVTFKELLAGLLQLKGLHIVGCDVNELSPGYDQSGVSTAVTCKIIRELILMLKPVKEC